MGQRNRESPTLYMLMIAQSMRLGELSQGQCEDRAKDQTLEEDHHLKGQGKRRKSLRRITRN